eukprot:SAG11_NODE_6333_length_1334_cov_1.620243_1_plen_235_part_00
MAAASSVRRQRRQRVLAHRLRVSRTRGHTHTHIFQAMETRAAARVRRHAALANCCGVADYVALLSLGAEPEGWLQQQSPSSAATSHVTLVATSRKGRGLVAARDVAPGGWLFSERPLHVIVSEPGNRLGGAMDFALAAVEAAHAHTLRILLDMATWTDMEEMFDDWTVDAQRAMMVSNGDVGGESLTKATLNTLCGVYCCNALTLTSTASAIMPMLDCINHSCDPNCEYKWNGA